MYFKLEGEELPILTAKDTKNTLWEQFILINQNRYGIAAVNSWGGEMVVDEEKNTILSAMIGAGIKDTANKFSGVLMGDV